MSHHLVPQSLVVFVSCSFHIGSGGHDVTEK